LGAKWERSLKNGTASTICEGKKKTSKTRQNEEIENLDKERELHSDQWVG